jgi:hypothetical protein
LLAQARDETQAVEPSNALLARIMADADQVLLTQTAAQPRAAADTGRSSRGGLWSILGGFVALVGGPRAVGGLMTAALTGVWIGAVSGPDVASYFGVEYFEGTSGGVNSSYALELMPGDDIFAMVGGIEG